MKKYKPSANQISNLLLMRRNLSITVHRYFCTRWRLTTVNAKWSTNKLLIWQWSSLISIWKRGKPLVQLISSPEEWLNHTKNNQSTEASFVVTSKSSPHGKGSLCSEQISRGNKRTFLCLQPGKHEVSLT